MSRQRPPVPAQVQALIDQGRYQVASTGIVVPTAANHYLTDEEWLAALQRQRARIAAGLTYEVQDSNVPGNKSTEASWGMCSTAHELWPTIELHVWPIMYLEHKRSEPRSRLNDGTQLCPFDRGRAGGPPPPNGCFYRCRIFQPRAWQPEPPTRDESLQAFDSEIAAVQKRIADRGGTP